MGEIGVALVVVIWWRLCTYKKICSATYYWFLRLFHKMCVTVSKIIIIISIIIFFFIFYFTLVLTIITFLLHFQVSQHILHRGSCRCCYNFVRFLLNARFRFALFLDGGRIGSFAAIKFQLFAIPHLPKVPELFPIQGVGFLEGARVHAATPFVRRWWHPFGTVTLLQNVVVAIERRPPLDGDRLAHFLLKETDHFFAAEFKVVMIRGSVIEWAAGTLFGLGKMEKV